MVRRGPLTREGRSNVLVALGVVRGADGEDVLSVRWGVDGARALLPLIPRGKHDKTVRMRVATRQVASGTKHEVVDGGGVGGVGGGEGAPARAVDAGTLIVHRLHDRHDATRRLQLGFASRSLPDVEEDETGLVGNSVVLGESGFCESFSDERACHMRTVRIRAFLFVVGIGVVEEDLAVRSVVAFRVVANGVRRVVEKATVDVYSRVGESDPSALTLCVLREDGGG